MTGLALLQREESISWDLFTIRNSIRTFMLKNFLFESEESTLADEASFLDQGIIDSTGILELISWIEEAFSIEILDEEMVPDNLDSINNILVFVMKKTGRGVAGAYL